jgi:hypothetical protein
MTADDRLKAALSLGADTPPEVDPVFAARVAERIERRRFQMRLAVLLLWAAAGAVLLWALRPVVGNLAGPIVPFLAPAAALAVMIWIGMRTDLSAVFRRVRRVRLSSRF